MTTWEKIARALAVADGVDPDMMMIPRSFSGQLPLAEYRTGWAAPGADMVTPAWMTYGRHAQAVIDTLALEAETEIAPLDLTPEMSRAAKSDDDHTLRPWSGRYGARDVASLRAKMRAQRDPGAIIWVTAEEYRAFQDGRGNVA